MDLEEIINQITKDLEGEAGSVLLIDENREDLFFAAAAGEKKAEVKDLRLALGEGIAGWVAKNNQIVLSDDVNQDPRFNSEISKKINFPNKAMICIPLESDNRVIGVIQIINKIGEKNAFTFADLDKLKSASLQVIEVLNNY